MRKKKIHNLKTWPEFFQQVIEGNKSFEVRENDRDYQVGDILILREWEPSELDYTGRTTAHKITYVLRDRPPFTSNGYAIMSFETSGLRAELTVANAALDKLKADNDRLREALINISSYIDSNLGDVGALDEIYYMVQEAMGGVNNE